MKKPDNVADNPGLLPYGSNVGAPSIKLDSTDLWKESRVKQANDYFKSKFEELKDQLAKLNMEKNWNEIIFGCNFSFEPVVGHTYHLYQNKIGDIFLSIVAPDEWDRCQYIGSFILDSTNKWNKIQYKNFQ